MDLRQTGLGVVIFLVFWAFQVGYFNSLGTTVWLIGKGAMPKASADQKELWMFATLFAIVSTALIAYAGPYLGAVFPAGFDPSSLTPVMLSWWLVIFGGAMLLTGWQMKWSVTTLVGIVWLFSAVHLQLTTGANSYLHFGMVTSLPFILYGLMMKK